MKNIYTLLFFALLTAFVSSCASPQKLLKNGRYDQAFSEAVQKVTKRKKDKNILALEASFRVLQQRDINRIEYLKKEGNPDCWEEVYALYSLIKTRQNQLQPLLPLYIKNEYRYADLNLLDIDQELIQAKQRAAEFHYAFALKLLEANDKYKARDAYDELRKLKQLYPTFRDVDEQLAKAHQLGLNHVLIQFKNTSQMALPADFENEFRKLDLHSLNSIWTNYYTQPEKNLNYDHIIMINLQEANPGMEQVKEREFKEEKEVQDGWSYVLDDNGNVMKDTTGNDIKVPKYKKISCVVKEVHQQKIATVAGNIDFINNRSSQLVRSIPFRETMIFEHHAAMAVGDLDALSKETRSRIGREPVPFPPPHAMMMDAAKQLRHQINRVVKDQVGLVMN